MRNVRRRGVLATAWAVVLLGLVGAAMLAIATLFASQSKQTAAVRIESQQRQLLLAGTAAARERLGRNELPAGPQVELTVPAPDGRVTLQRLADHDGRAVVEVRAWVGKASTREVVTLERAAEGWRVTGAQLGGAGAK